MSNWEGLTVAQLKDELKQRNIPLTGLKLKKDFIAKLDELTPTSNDDNSENARDHINGAPDEAAHQEELDKQDAPSINADTLPPGPTNGIATEDTTLPDSTVTPKQNDSQSPLAAATDEVMAMEETSMHVPEPDEEQKAPQLSAEHETVQEGEAMAIGDGTKHDVSMGKEDVDAAEVQHATTTTEASDFDRGQVKVLEPSPGADRKRRRSSPDMDGREQAQKLVKTNQGQAIRSSSKSPQPEGQTYKVAQEQSPSQRRPSIDPEEDVMEEEHNHVEAAKHPTTSTLYMCNFKRPINQQELKARITAVATGARAPTSGVEPVKLFYMDKIRSHAFVAFQSVAHAVKVRSAMHGHKFPPEPQRDPVWVDYIPDDKVEGFIDQESQSQSNFQSGGRGAGASSRFQIVYRDTDGGVEAVLQDASQARHLARSGTATGATDRLSYSQRDRSYTTEATRTPTSTIASTVHPDRANLIPQPRAMNRPASAHRHERELKRPPRRPQAEQGSGFKELDDLFSSTQAKPRLYFKLPAQELVQDRLAMIRALIPAAGKSGEPGMKRYTFEESDGREEWVDNGPEFGRGWRGQDRLEGKAGGRGRGRRRAGGYDRRGLGKASIDSYRGEGRAAVRDWDAPPR